MANNDNVIFKTSTTKTIDDLLNWNKATGEISAKTSSVAISPGTVYFTSDGHILYDLDNNNRLWMSKEAYSAIYAKNIDEANNDIVNLFVKKSGDTITGNLIVNGNVNLNNSTYTDDLTTKSLLVNGNSRFINNVAFTQSPTAPTPAAASNDTTVATTAFVNIAINALDVSSISNTANKTIATISETDGKIAVTFQDIDMTSTTGAKALWSLSGGIKLEPTADNHIDLNNYINPGNYYCNLNSSAKFIDNNPYGDNTTLTAFILKVVHSVGFSSNNKYIRQELIEYTAPQRWWRYKAEGGWTSWKNSATTPAGSTTQPIYINDLGIPTAISYTINKSVPSDAVFTDTTYSSKTAASGGTDVSLVTTGEKYTWNNKQNALATQTSYNAKGSATKVAQITTNSLGQVTGITEVDINFPTASSLGLSSAMIFKGSIGQGGTLEFSGLPTASNENLGFTYKVISNGTVGSNSVKTGDVIVSNGTSWVIIPSGDEPNGTVTSITLTAGNGITVSNSGTAITTSGTRTISHADTSSVSNLTKNGRTYVTGLTFDTYGHVTGYTTGTETVTDTNKYHKTGSWNELTYTATSVNNAETLAFTIPTGTSATTVAVGNHTHSWSSITNKATTIAGYGITDAKITNGVITLGSNTITPLTADSVLHVDKLNRYPYLKVSLNTDSPEEGVELFDNVSDGEAVEIGVEGILSVSHGGTGVSTTTKNYVFVGPSSSNGAPSFRKLVAADIPDLSGTYLTSHQTVVNNNINLSRNVETTIATIGGTAIKIKLPASDNTDYKVRQTPINSNDNNNYRILLSNSTNDTSEDSISKKNANLIYNPKENELSTGNIKLTGELDVTGNVYLRNQTTVDNLVAGSLIVNGNSTFINNVTFTQSPTAPTPAAASNDTTVATTAFVTNAVTQGFVANDAMVFKGLIGSNQLITQLPTSGYNTGWTYRVADAGIFAGEYCEVGDLLIAIKDGPDSGSSVINNDWGKVEHNIDGAVFMGHAGSAIGGSTQPVYVKANGEVVTGTSLKALAYKDSISYTPTGSIADTSITPEGTISSTSITPAGTNAKSAVTIKATTTDIYSMNSAGNVTAGTAASLTMNVEDEVLSFSWTTNTPTAVTLPDRSSVIKAWTGYTTGVDDTYAAAQVFTGTEVSHSHTFTGTAASHKHTFTGTAATLS